MIAGEDPSPTVRLAWASDFTANSGNYLDLHPVVRDQRGPHDQPRTGPGRRVDGCGHPRLVLDGRHRARPSRSVRRAGLRGDLHGQPARRRGGGALSLGGLDPRGVTRRRRGQGPVRRSRAVAQARARSATAGTMKIPMDNMPTKARAPSRPITVNAVSPGHPYEANGAFFETRAGRLPHSPHRTGPARSGRGRGRHRRFLASEGARWITGQVGGRHRRSVCTRIAGAVRLPGRRGGPTRRWWFSAECAGGVRGPSVVAMFTTNQVYDDRAAGDEEPTGGVAVVIDLMERMGTGCRASGRAGESVATAQRGYLPLAGFAASRGESWGWSARSSSPRSVRSSAHSPCTAWARAAGIAPGRSRRSCRW